MGARDGRAARGGAGDPGRRGRSLRQARDRGPRRRAAPSSPCASATFPRTSRPRRSIAEGLRADVAFGGAFYGSVASPLPVSPRNLPELIELGRAVKAGLEAQREFVHPEEPELRGIYGVIFWERIDFGPPLRQRNVTVFADGEVDRSPCGSGTSARLALLERAGELPRGTELLHESIIGTEFRARVVGDAEVAGRPAVVTEVEGSASRTGSHEFVLAPGRPPRRGLPPALSGRVPAGHARGLTPGHGPFGGPNV